MRALRLLPLVLLAGGCLETDWGDLERESLEIVGGRAEASYSAVGYLVAHRGTSTVGPFCGATLVRPDVAVTAAHCVEAAIEDFGATSIAIGFGAVGSSPTHVVQRAVMHPRYLATSQVIQYDVAVLVLASPVSGITPAGIAAPEVGCGFRSVGYGRVLTGPADSTQGYTGERKSMSLCVDGDGASPGMLLITGQDGGLCYGDSGGAVMVEGQDLLVGIHSFIYDGTCPEGGRGGVESAAAAVGFFEDEANGLPPSVALAAPADGAHRAPGFTIQVDADDDYLLDRVEIAIDGIVHQTLTEPPFAFTTPEDLAEGERLLEARAFDAAGKSTEAAARVVVDRNAGLGDEDDDDPLGPQPIVGGCSAGGAGQGGGAALAILAALLFALGRRREIAAGTGDCLTRREHAA